MGAGLVDLKTDTTDWPSRRYVAVNSATTGA